MGLLTWSDAYSVNVTELDNQHKKFFEMMNEMHEAMRAGKGKEALGSILNEIVSYTKVHFAHEEQLFQRYGYPDADQHSAIHAAFVKQALDLQQKYESGNTMLSIEVMTMLKDWLINHIQGSDMQYGPFFNDKGVN